MINPVALVLIQCIRFWINLVKQMQHIGELKEKAVSQDAAHGLTPDCTRPVSAKFRPLPQVLATMMITSSDIVCSATSADILIQSTQPGCITV